MEPAPQELCSNCQRQAADDARAVAPFVSSLDQATVENLRARLPSFAWELDETTNVPHCKGEGCLETEQLGGDDDASRCYASKPYQRHLRAAMAGFHSIGPYLALQYQLTQQSTYHVPVPHLVLEDSDDEDEGMVPRPASPTSGARRPVHSLRTNDEAPDPSLMEHMQRLRQQQSARGRLVISHFLHSDDAARNRNRGVEITLQAHIQRATLESAELDDCIVALQRTRDLGRDELREMQQTLDARDSQLPHKPAYARKPHGDDAGPSTSPVPLTPLEPFGDLSFTGLTRLSPAQLEKLRKRLKSMKMPACDQSPEVFARWMQVGRVNRIKGVPICGPDWVVDLRDVRGRNCIVPRVPVKTRFGEDIRHHTTCLLAVLRVLARPRAYSKSLGQLGISVAQKIRFSCDFEKGQEPTDDEVVQVLANQGLSQEAADDAWQFAVKLLEALPKTLDPNHDGHREATALLELVKKDSELEGSPPGLYAAELDQLQQFQGLAG
ncbi:hypothetical protein DFH06DRAFT_1321198 [Mycena polygramma]|nr:hypothetical protein DFH06DRAFT_1321198 [Mycena polygramma]